MTKPFLLGIDAGTSQVKTVIFDHDGNEVCLSRARIPVETQRTGWAEQDMDLVWESIKKTVAECLAPNNISKYDIAAIGIAGQGDGCRLVDRHYRPVRNSILWLDGRAGDIIKEWEMDRLGDSSFDISGSVMFAGAPAAILEWLARNEKKTLKEASHFLFAKDWIKLKLTGKIVTDPSDASRAPFDIRKSEYSQDIFRLLNLDHLADLFPPIRPSTEIIGEVTTEAARETGLAAGTPVVNGMIDVVACGMGVGAINHGQAYSIVGTTCFNGLIMERVDLKPAGTGMSLAYALPNHILRAMPSLAGTPNLDWFIDRFCAEEKSMAEAEQVSHFELLEKETAKISVGADGVLYHPYICPGGERAPFVKPSAAAQFFGLKLIHTKWHMLRAVYEGVALSILDCFEHIPVGVSDLMLCGGGARSNLWCQIIADATCKTVNIPTGDEPGALGASIAAALGIGIYSGIEKAIAELLSVKVAFQPNRDNNRIYRELYELYRSLYLHEWNDWDLRKKMISGLQGDA